MTDEWPALQELRPGQLWRRSDNAAEELVAALRSFVGVPIALRGAGGIVHLHFAANGEVGVSCSEWCERDVTLTWLGGSTYELHAAGGDVLPIHWQRSAPDMVSRVD